MNNKKNNSFWKHPAFLLVIGSLLLISSGMRINVSITAWLFPIPFLYYLRLNYPKKWLLISLLISSILQISKIASEPMYLFIAIFGGLSTGFSAWLILLLKEKIRISLGEWTSVFAFAALVAVFEFINMYASPLGTWGMLANTQVDNLLILQLVSITGATGIAFLISWFSALLESIIFQISQGKNERMIFLQSGLYVFVIIMTYVFGAWRLDVSRPAKTTQVFTVTSKKFNVRDVLNSDQARKDNNLEVLNLIREAAEKNPSLIVTNEGALFLSPDETELTFKYLKALSQNYSTDISAGYIIYNGKGQKFLNKSLWISKGKILQEYHKQFIPIGEPSVKVPDTIKVLDAPFDRASMAICYDFDSISLTNTHGKMNTSLVALPSSDWRGIDPIHTQMAKVRAIENGYSVIRSVRAATTEVYDGLGRTRAMSRWYESENELMEAQVPVNSIPTFYKIAGNWFSWLNIFCLSFILFKTYRPKK